MAAAVLVVTGRGDAFLLAGLLGLASFDRRTAAVSVGASIAVVVRWGTSSLPAIGGAQAVLGPALAVEPVLGAVAVVLAAAALVVAAPVGLAAAVFGGAAGVFVAGPSPTGPVELLTRLAAIAAAAALAWWLQPRLPDRVRESAPVLATAAVVAAVLS